ERSIIVDGAERVRILNQGAGYFCVENEGVVITDDHLDAERLRARADDLDVLRVTILRDEKGVSALLVFEPMEHHHRLGGGGGFIEEGRVRDLESGKVADQRLEIQQHFQAALGNL